MECGLFLAVGLNHNKKVEFVSSSHTYLPSDSSSEL